MGGSPAGRMRIYRSLDEARGSRFRHAVATLGVFDGVHVGHRYVLRECLRLAEERAGESVVVTFRTHPRAVIAGKAPKLITSIEHRLRLFGQLGFDHCLVLEFDEALREIPAKDFAHEVFEEILDAEIVVLGHNCRFGKDQVGSADWLIAHAGEFAFEARKALEVRFGEANISSTAIRAAIESGDLERAASMLGRPFAIYGTVVRGDGRGKAIGVPTANLDLHHELKPPNGVYGVRIDGDDDLRRYGVLNIGVRPTFKTGLPAATVEVHLFDFDGDLYGKDLEVMFVKRLRGEKKFATIEALVAQIEADKQSFRDYLADPPAVPHLGGA